MNQRLLQFLSAENISQAQFADTIGVARASVSHILAGRNKPGFDFIESMSSHFPDLSLEWLINGKGKMYKSVTSAPVVEPVRPAELPIEAMAVPSPAVLEPSDVDSGLVKPVKMSEAIPTSAPPAEPRVGAENGKKSDVGTAAQRSISRIIVFYDDNTYQELK